MRIARIKAENEGFYHVISRFIERRKLFGPKEQEVFRFLLRQTEAFCGVKVLTYAILSSHFHLLVHIPERQELTDQQLLERLAIMYEPDRVKEITERLAQYRQQALHQAAEELKAQFTYRMYDLSEFLKTLKQRFSQWYNCREDRCGPLWEGRFKSILVQDTEEALLAIAGAIFVVEALSVILQVLSYRYRNKKRIFLCAPLHHHFEYKGWPETKVVVRFWIVSLLFAIISIASLKFQ